MYCFCPDPRYTSYVSVDCPYGAVSVKSDKKHRFLDNRSSDNFEVPKDGYYVISTPSSSCEFIIGIDVKGIDNYLGRGSSGEWVYLNKGVKYYIASPKNYDQRSCPADFTVCFKPV